MGTKVDEQDPACVPNAKYTLGEFSVSGASVNQQLLSFCELGALLKHPITDLRLTSRENPNIIQSEGTLSSKYMLAKFDHCLLSFLHEINK